MDKLDFKSKLEMITDGIGQLHKVEYVYESDSEVYASFIKGVGYKINLLYFKKNVNG